LTTPTLKRSRRIISYGPYVATIETLQGIVVTAIVASMPLNILPLTFRTHSRNPPILQYHLPTIGALLPIAHTDVCRLNITTLMLTNDWRWCSIRRAAGSAPVGILELCAQIPRQRRI